MKRVVSLSVPLALMALACSATSHAQPGLWSASAVTGVPHFPAAGAVSTQTCDVGCGHGRGVRLAAGFAGTAYLYSPVTSVHGITFGKINLRAEDNTPGGYVRAEFVRQPRNLDLAGAVTLGSVTTVDAVGDGFQVATAVFAPVILDLTHYSYYIRITLKRDAGQINITAYDVSLQP